MDSYTSLHVDASITNGNIHIVPIVQNFDISNRIIILIATNHDWFISVQWTNFLSPDNIKGLSASSMLLAMVGNGLMIPRALFIRDFMW